MRVLIEGAGGLASGIALCLHRCGFGLVMTNIVVPTTVCRTAAFSPAVYEGTAVAEDATGVLRQNQEEVQEAVRADRIAVVVDDRRDTRNTWKPEVIVDAIIAKKNLGIAIGDIQTVIDMGPGFTVGVDCHRMVETRRGHNLGRHTWDDSAVPNTEVPGMIGGYDKERIIRAGVDGIFTDCVSIGDLVGKGQLAGRVGETPVHAEAGGVVRGPLQDGVAVCKGMKSGDVDPRGVVENCSTVSDKVSVIGGSVLEAILSHIKLMWHIQRREK